MKPQFNLVHEAWIPVIDHSGGPQLVSLLQIFRQGRELRSISDASPLTTMALYRLVLAIVFRTHPVRLGERWRGLVQDGWQIETIERYLQAHESRFDLFDEATPFFQRGDLNPDDLEPAPLSKLTHEFASKNNKQMFDHSCDDFPRRCSPAEAARILLTSQCWSLGGGVSGGSRPNFTGALLIGGIATLLEGSSLQQTLLLNTFPLPRVAQGPHALSNTQDAGTPVWERDGQERHEKRLPSGTADIFTWESRYVRLLPHEDGTVSHALFVQGEQVDLGGRSFIDPMHAWRQNKEQKNQPVPFRPDRAAWRDGTALLTSLGLNEGEGPAAAVRAAGSDRMVAPSDRVALSFAALANKKADPVLWTWQRFRVPGTLLDVDTAAKAVRLLSSALQLADKVEKALRASLADLGRSIAFERFQSTGMQGNMNREQRDRAETFVDRLCRTDHYWARLELRFQELLDDLENEGRWSREVRGAALEAFTLSTTSLELTPRHARGLAHARSRFYRTLSHYIPKEAQNAA